MTNFEEDSLENGQEIDKLDEEVKTKDTELLGLPVDRGWAWFVLAGGVMYAGIYGGVSRSFGVYFLQYQERFKALAAEVAVMSLIENITSSLMGLVVMTVGLKKLSCRTVVAIGGGLIALSYMLSSLTEDIRLLYLFQGFLHGTGLSMVRSPTISVIGIYFKKHRGLATSIYTGSASIGGLIFAPVVNKLFSEFGYTGAMLITGSLFSNILVSASLMRPPSWFRSRGNKQIKSVFDRFAGKYLIKTSDESTSQSEYNGSDGKKIDAGKSNTDKFDHGQYLNEKADTYMNAKEPDSLPSSSYQEYHSLITTKPPTVENCMDTAFRKHDVDQDRRQKTDTYNIRIDQEITYDQMQPVAADRKEIKIPLRHQRNKYFQCLNVCAADLHRVFDVNLLKDLSFITYLSMAFLLISGMALVPFYLPQFAKDADLSYSQIAVMISIMSCTDFVSRVVSGIIADRKWVRRSTMLAVAAIAVGSICQFARFFTTYILIVCMAVFIACFFGWYTSMYSTILIDCVGLDKLQSSLGFVSLVHGISVGVCFPITGLLRDTTGSYVYSLHLAGCLCYGGAVLLLLMPIIQKKLKKNEAVVSQELK